MARIGIALSGGAARSIAHLGVLEVFKNTGIPIHVLSGTSGGALVGALYCSGRYSFEQLVQRADGLKWWEVTRPVVSKRGLLSSDRIGRFVGRFLGNSRFDQLGIPFAVAATDIVSGKKVVLREGLVSKAVQASCSLPIIFEPTVINGRSLIDGGYSSQIPVLAAREDLGADFVIAVDVNYGGMEGAGLPQNMIQIAIHLASLWARKNAEEEGRLADCLVRVNVSGIGLTDLGQSRELLKRGRHAATSLLPTLQKQLANLT
jgi:NTE family protein